MEKKLTVFGAAFLDGFSLGGFLTPLRRPGAPSAVFSEPLSGASSLEAVPSNGSNTAQAPPR